MGDTKPSFVISDEELGGLLARYTRDITALDRAGKYDPITGREDALERMTLILMQRLRKNVALLGPAGSGKTALFTGLAQRINQNLVPDMLKGAQLIELEMTMIGAGSESRAILEGRLIPILKGVSERNATRAQPPIIFCIDEFHQLTLAFKSSSYSGVIDLMKPYLTSGDLYVIGATTREEYDDYIKIEPAIDRRFQKIFMEVPDLKMTEQILRNLRPNFESHYHIKVTDEDCARIVKLTDKFIRNRNNPDKSIIVMDIACAIAVKAGEKEKLTPSAIENAIAGEAGIDAAAIG